MLNDGKLKKIIEHYGVLHQLKHFQTEVFELSEAIIDTNIFDDLTQAGVNVFRDNRECFLKHVTEEVADVLVMLSQFILYYGLDMKQIDEVMNQKINRQVKRVDADKETTICPNCGEECDELFDTEGRVHGGIGYVCEQCLEDLDIY